MIYTIVGTSILLAISFGVAALPQMNQPQDRTAAMRHGECVPSPTRPRGKYFIVNVERESLSERSKKDAVTRPVNPECGPRLLIRSRVT